MFNMNLFLLRITFALTTNDDCGSFVCGVACSDIGIADISRQVIIQIQLIDFQIEFYFIFF
jgi:hypothetical protein